MTTKEIISIYGKPNIIGEDYLTVIDLPYPMKLAWDLDTTVVRLSVHRKLSTAFTNIFNDILYTYGLDEIQRLKIDILGGCMLHGCASAEKKKQLENLV